MKSQKTKNNWWTHSMEVKIMQNKSEVEICWLEIENYFYFWNNQTKKYIVFDIKKQKVKLENKYEKHK